jgi:hypothetical protein
MKSRRVALTAVALAVLLTFIAGYTLAGASSARGDLPAQSPQTVSSQVGRSFTYQGVLKENGQPVTGTRAMTFFLHRDGDCTSPFSDISNSAVEVFDGLFTVELPVQNNAFDGQAVWLQAEVAGQKLGCQEITAVPYALSLVPGAWMLGSVTGDAMLEVVNQSNTGGGSGIGVTTHAPEGRALVGGAESTTGVNYGVYGASGSPDGYGVYGRNDSGVAVGAEGAIQSTADSVLYLSPHDLVQRAASTTTPELYDIDVLPLDGGGVRVQNVSGGSIEHAYFSIPMSTFGTLLGSQMYVKSLEVCYKVSNATIDATAVMKNNGTATGYSFYMLDATPRTAASRACYTVTDAVPHTAVDNSSWVQFNVTMNAFPPVYVDIYTVKVTLTQLASD